MQKLLASFDCFLKGRHTFEGRAGLGRHAAAFAWRFRGTIRSHDANVPRAGDAQRPTAHLKSQRRGNSIFSGTEQLSNHLDD